MHLLSQNVCIYSLTVGQLPVSRYIRVWKSCDSKTTNISCHNVCALWAAHPGSTEIPQGVGSVKFYYALYYFNSACRFTRCFKCSFYYLQIKYVLRLKKNTHVRAVIVRLWSRDIFAWGHNTVRVSYPLTSFYWFTSDPLPLPDSICIWCIILLYCTLHPLSAPCVLYSPPVGWLSSWCDWTIKEIETMISKTAASCCCTDRASFILFYWTNIFKRPAHNLINLFYVGDYCNPVGCLLILLFMPTLRRAISPQWHIC